MEEISRKQKRVNLCVTNEEVGVFTDLSAGTVSYYENYTDIHKKNKHKLDVFYFMFKQLQDEYLKTKPPFERNEQYITGSEAARESN